MKTETTPMRAFHGDAAVKEKYLARVRAHAAADEIINGQYWENGKGCAVGCTLHSARHSSYETELGIPRVLAKLEDRMFEKLFLFDAPAAKKWPEQFLAAPKVGADLILVWPRFALWLLLDSKDGVRRFTKDGSRAREAVDKVGALYTAWVGGTKPPAERFKDAYVCALVATADVDVAACCSASCAAAAASAAADVADYATSADSASEQNTLCLKQCAKLLELMAAAT